MKYLIIVIALTLGGCAATNEGPFDPNFWAEENLNPWYTPVVVVVPKPVVAEPELDVAPAPVVIPEPYKGYGWTAAEYEALVKCEGAGGKMGKSKKCRGASK